MSNLKQRFEKLSVPQFLSAGFLSVILIGAILLMLPISSRSGQVTPFIDALFTAVSATCVTGQVIYNTAAHWSAFGQIVIISLIEIGGLGIMTIIVLLLLFLGKKLNLKERLLIHDSLNLSEDNDATVIVKYILKFALVTQALGALVLSTQLIPQFGLLKGVYYSIFHAISAFCNAGFDLFGDSLVSYTSNPVVMLTISFLIIFGGLGFIVWRDLLTYRKNKKLLLHTRVTLAMTLSLLVIGSVVFFLSERSNSFGDLPLHYQIMNSFFMAVTPRTAGFANVDYSQLVMGSLILTSMLMFIGGASGSTAGGIKVTTISTLFLYLKSQVKGERATINKRSIPNVAIRKSVTLLLISILLCALATLILSFTEVIPEGFGLEYIIVEVFSCFGTVGLTMGLTPNLSFIGKIILSLMMFMGRVGLLTVTMSFAQKNKPDTIVYPDGNIMIG